MAGKLAPCGTYAAYKRHVRRGEPVDDACAATNTEEAQASISGAATAMAVRKETFISEESEVDLKTLNKLDDALENLRIVRASLKACPPSAVANLSKRRQELTEYIVMLRDGIEEEGKDPVDAIAERRANRPAVA